MQPTYTHTLTHTLTHAHTHADIHADLCLNKICKILSTYITIRIVTVRIILRSN